LIVFGVLFPWLRKKIGLRKRALLWLCLAMAVALVAYFLGGSLWLSATLLFELAAYLLVGGLRKASTITVKVNPLDQEATAYWSQLGNALKRTEWTVELSTTNTPPSAVNVGLSIYEAGINNKSVDPKCDPRAIIQRALHAAHIQVNGGGS
jgi:hypothetical protein